MVKKEEKQQSLIRIMGTDISTTYFIIAGLTKIKGVNYMFSNAICNVLKLDKNKRIADLTEKQVEQIEEFLSKPEKKEIPVWMLNQRGDFETGKNLHIVSKDIEYNLLQVKRKLGKLKTYKGLRHRARLPLRGQRTKANFRKNKTLASMKSKREVRK